jgi:hypothetical protein
MDKKIPIFAVIIVLVILFLAFFNRDTINSTARACSQDSDCILTTSGACGSDCPVAINQKYKTLWESAPDSVQHGNTCALIGVCIPQGIENYQAKCLQAECGAGAECIGNAGGMCAAVPKPK